MARSLVIVESPAKAKTINKYLGREYIVKASFGHVMDLPKKTLGILLPGDENGRSKKKGKRKTKGKTAEKPEEKKQPKPLVITDETIFEPTLEEEVAVDEGQLKISEEIFKMSVDELDLPVRITNALRAADIETVEQLVNVPRQQLLKAKNLGGKSLSLISEKLTERGLNLSEA